MFMSLYRYELPEVYMYELSIAFEVLLSILSIQASAACHTEEIITVQDFRPRRSSWLVLMCSQ